MIIFTTGKLFNCQRVIPPTNIYKPSSDVLGGTSQFVPGQTSHFIAAIPMKTSTFSEVQSCWPIPIPAFTILDIIKQSQTTYTWFAKLPSNINKQNNKKH